MPQNLLDMIRQVEDRCLPSLDHALETVIEVVNDEGHNGNGFMYDDDEAEDHEDYLRLDGVSVRLAKSLLEREDELREAARRLCWFADQLESLVEEMDEDNPLKKRLMEGIKQNIVHPSTKPKKPKKVKKSADHLTSKEYKALKVKLTALAREWQDNPEVHQYKLITFREASRRLRVNFDILECLVEDTDNLGYNVGVQIGGGGGYGVHDSVGDYTIEYYGETRG